MAFTLWSQDFFAKGELSPLLYSRVTLQAYYQGLKRAKNVLCTPQGSASKRFGTKYVSPVINAVSADTIYFKAFQYLNECTYLVILQNLTIDVYLGPNRVASIVSPIAGPELRDIDHTVIENRFRVTSGIRAPYDLIRTANAANAITGFSSDTLTVTTALTLNGFWPARFTAPGTPPTLPATSPQIYQNRTYFVRAVTTTTIRIFNNAIDAENNENYFTVTSAGTSANLNILNNWTFSAVSFRNLPVFDFVGGYDGLTFTPNAVSGFGKTLTASAAFWTDAYIGGVYVGNGGVARIVSRTSPTAVVIDIINGTSFADTTAIPGSESVVTEPAWSTARGWPRRCSSFQNRAFFANTDSLTNGLWGSATNDFEDFDATAPSIPDSSIAWFPSSDNVNYIEFIVPYRSLTIHTNTGVYSTPVSVDTAITPDNFSMTLQDTHPADNIQPQGIDNQIIAVSGNDVHGLLWDGYNNAYTSNIISIFNEQLIRSPVDQASYSDFNRAGSRYMFIVNADGTLAVYQTLITENVSGFTPVVLEQSYGNAYFRWVTSSTDGRAWFVTERELATEEGPYVITAYTSTTLTNGTYDFSTDTPTLINFVSGALPESTPQVVTETNYWAIGVATNEFKLYLTQDDATNDENAIVFDSAGTSAAINVYPLASNFIIEELSFDAKMDCIGLYPTATTTVPTPAITTITGQTRFTGQDIYMQGDGFGYEEEVVDGEVAFIAHGMEREVSDAQYGFPINVEITPLPISLSTTGNPKSSNLLESKHISFASFTFVDTIGGTITQGGNTFPIALTKLEEIIPGDPPVARSGAFEISVFNAWDDFTYDNFTINHSEPFDLQLTGIFYKVDV